MIVPVAFLVQIQLTRGFYHGFEVGVVRWFRLWVGLLVQQSGVSRHHRGTLHCYRHLWQQSILKVGVNARIV